MLSSPNSLGTLTGLQDSLARIGGFGQFTDLHADRQSILNGWLELAIDHLARARNWTFHRVEGVALETLPLYTTGTVAINANSGALTGTGTDWVQTPAVMVAGRSMVSLGSASVAYILDTLTSDTAITIRPTLGGTTNLSASTYEIGTPDYELATDTWMLLDIREVHPSGGRLIFETPAEWLARTRGVWQTGRPTHAVLLGNSGTSTSTQFRVRLWPCPDDRYRYLYRYRKVPTWQTGGQHEAPQMTDLVVYKALELQADAGGQHEAAQRWEAKYREAVQAAGQMDAARAGQLAVEMAPQWRGGRRYGPRIVGDPTGEN